GVAEGSVAISGPIHTPFNRYLVGMTEPSTSARFDGQIAELLLYDRALSDCERDDVVATLGTRYGIAVGVTGGDCTPPAAPTNLGASAVDHQRIDLAWTDNATTEEGYRIERRQGQTGTWNEIGTVGPDVTVYTDTDPALTPQTEYCYRVVAFNSNANSDYSNVSCVTTQTIAPVSCSLDVADARGVLTEVLTTSIPSVVEWREGVGLLNADPNGLVLITEDAVCATLWAAVRTRPPYDGYFTTFFQVGTLSIVTEYPNSDPNIGPTSLGRRLTTVVNEQFDVVNPTLAH
ncbi:MAG TPA: fibronectin type III domain-containing protein, partial [Gemmatimonadota bacterium]|nr:fibronectin type III domain-containing protein [Gemmatimonadota bacterium]